MLDDTLFFANLDLASKIADQHCRRKAIYDRETRRNVKADALIGLMEAARKYDGREGVKFSTFAHTIISRRIVDAYRRMMNGRGKRFKEKRIIYVDELPDIPVLDSFVDRFDAEMTVHALLQSLDERSKKVVVQYYGIGGPRRKLREIGLDIGVTESAVSRIVSGAIKSMRKCLFADLHS